MNLSTCPRGLRLAPRASTVLGKHVTTVLCAQPSFYRDKTKAYYFLQKGSHAFQDGLKLRILLPPTLPALGGIWDKT